ncbi:HPr kinase/phosphorylase [Yoonia sp. BS5-3]|uniref:HPr kinase/phosphorylase n=1 Tax=Yoonia phaeophyticola TaxID=3137369 RepID=A0ABZ2VBI3_9RHOB
MTDNAAGMTMHASCVAWGEAGVLIKGASGCGKSALALTLMAYGCQLVADDQVRLERRGDGIIASCPPTITGLIEARGVGLLHADMAPPTLIVLVVDLETDETSRLPERHSYSCLGCALPLINRISGAHFAPAILQYLKAGRSHDR